MKAAVYTGTRNLYKQMETAAKSLLINSDVDKIYFLIEDDEFPYELPDCIETRNMSGQTFFKPDGPNMKSHFTYFAMLRAALCYIFPDLDVILSLDTDTVVDADISGLWDLDLDGYYFAASREPQRCIGGLLYTNAGVTLFNLKKLRDGKAQEAIDVLNTTEFKWLDQDVLNYLCQGRILDLDSSYNVNAYTVPTRIYKILHYAGVPNETFRTFKDYKKYKNIQFSDIRR